MSEMTTYDGSTSRDVALAAVRNMAADWYCPFDASRPRIDCPECIAAVALDAYEAAKSPRPAHRAADGPRPVRPDHGCGRRAGRRQVVVMADGTHPRWIDGEMEQPWFRDLIAGSTAEHVADLTGWAERIAHTYSRSGTLEVTAVVWALLDRIDALQADREVYAAQKAAEELGEALGKAATLGPLEATAWMARRRAALTPATEEQS